MLESDLDVIDWVVGEDGQRAAWRMARSSSTTVINCASMVAAGGKPAITCNRSLVNLIRRDASISNRPTGSACDNRVNSCVRARSSSSMHTSLHYASTWQASCTRNSRSTKSAIEVPVAPNGSPGAYGTFVIEAMANVDVSR